MTNIHSVAQKLSGEGDEPMLSFIARHAPTGNQVIVLGPALDVAVAHAVLFFHDFHISKNAGLTYGDGTVRIHGMSPPNREAIRATDRLAAQVKMLLGTAFEELSRSTDD